MSDNDSKRDTDLAPTVANRPKPAATGDAATAPAQGWSSSHGEAATIAVGTGAPKGGDGSTHPLAVTSTGAEASSFDTERYRIGELLGRGGMGEVVLAFDEQLGREVAIKRIRGEASGELLARFLREVRVQGRLQHPAVVPVHDLAFDKERRPYFVMKRLSGTTMADLLPEARTDERARQRLLRAFVDVCLAIEFAHKCGIVHRDLKPANIMLGEFGEVYVLDWGVARALADATDVADAADAPAAAAPAKPPSNPVGKDPALQLDSGETRLGAVLGTPAYMAPEQLGGERAGPAADIYALGCILFEIASGRMLHEGRRSVMSIASPPDAAPSHVRPDAPPELDRICERATQVEPTDRFSSARELGDAVQYFLDGDRDLALRRELAKKHIAAAQEALAGGTDEASRSTAMQQAGRALALDPTASDAADLVTRLVLEPPSRIPAEVDARIAAMDTATARVQGKLAAWSQLGYLSFVPLLLWSGIRDATLVVALALLAITCGLHVWLMTRGERIRPGGVYASAIINAVLIAVISRIVGPFIIAPTLVMTVLMAYAAHPKFGSMLIVAPILAAGVAVPWFLEIIGVLDPTYRFTDKGDIVLSSSVVRFSALPVQLAFAGLLVILVGVVAVLTRGMAVAQRRAARAVEIQAWHLRQLMPTNTP